MPSRFERSLARLKASHADLVTDTAIYPYSATLAPVNGGSSSAIRLDLSNPKEARHFDTTGEEYRVERNVAHLGVFPAGVRVALGDRLTMTAPADVAGQVFEVVEPVRPDALRYKAGLAYVSGGSR